ncbi:hypothetical protein AB0M05_34805 [Streptomyces violaceusniger]|uniref:hypothetical protein n=1 Tax=Streptomyces violaceusniger TaxID=68280 RepID=UPI00341E0C82
MNKGPSGPVPPTSTRAQLIESGVLVDVPTLALQTAGLPFPVGFTATAWAMYVGDQKGRLEMVLTEIGCTVAQMFPESESGVVSGLSTISGQLPGPRDQLHVEMHPGDQSEVVLTLLLPADY